MTRWRLARADRKSLLLGTALASTLICGCLLAPRPAQAAVCPQPASPAPISALGVNDFIICVNTEPRTNVAGNAISLQTINNNQYISLDNSGRLTATNAAGAAIGIIAFTDGNNSPITVLNSGDITATSAFASLGIDARAFDTNSPIEITNSGDVSVSGGNTAFGINARTYATDSPTSIVNSGDIAVVANTFTAYGVFVHAYDNDSPIEIWNSGDITVSAIAGGFSAHGIYARTGSAVVNTNADDSPITIVNSGDIAVTSLTNDAFGIRARDLFGEDSPVAIGNSGNITLSAYNSGVGIDIDACTATFGGNCPVQVVNVGDITINSGRFGFGFKVFTNGDGSPVSIENSGDITVTPSLFGAEGIDVVAADINSPISIVNSGDIVAISPLLSAKGMDLYTQDNNSAITVVNSGKITASGTYNLFGPYASYGITAVTEGANSPIVIKNSGTTDAEIGINAEAYGPGSSITISNSGSVYGDTAAILALSSYGTTTIVNSGDISAGSQRAIDADGGATEIFNRGLITGFVDLTDEDDAFENQSGGVFETKLTSSFGGGDDLFNNKSGSTILAATNVSKTETSALVRLETFKNAGLISMADGKEGDSFIISNTPGGTDLVYQGNGGTLGVDAFLGGPGSKSDTFTIEGDVSGKTYVDVFNTNPGPGVFNSQGIPVVFATGETPNANAFRLQGGPIDTGFFSYDLFFESTGSGQWELRSFAGGGAHLLPQLLTAAQDIWHQSSATWFDRTADLRVLMHGEPAPSDLGGKSLAVPVQEQLTPAVWIKGGGSWLDRDTDANTRAYGRTYNFNLDRELETFDVQVGIDMGTRDVFGSGDALVFGVLGGFVHGDLDYDSLARRFQYDGGQVGVYATYLSGGLFVDTLLNANIYELDGNNVTFPGSVDGNTVGLRTDAGYRFGAFSGGPFVEPLATIEVMWVDLDGFISGGNRVSFDDEANVRGRLGLRAGTTSQISDGVVMEPFVIGSVWGNLSDDNTATLVSSGRTFRFRDNPEDVWGEVSAGVNFFNFTQTIAVFGKVDVSFGDDLTGVGGKGGMRVVW